MSFNKALPPSHLGNVQTSLTLLSVCRRLSIVKRLGGSSAAKVRLLFELCKSLGRKIVQDERKINKLVLLFFRAEGHGDRYIGSLDNGRKDNAFALTARGDNNPLHPGCRYALPWAIYFCAYSATITDMNFRIRIFIFCTSNCTPY